MMNGMEVSGNGHQTHHHYLTLQQQLQGNKQSQSIPVSNTTHHPFQSNGPYHQFPDAGNASGKRSGIPPASPYSQFPSAATSRSPPPLPSGAGVVNSHSGSLSQPPFFSLDVLPPFNPSSSPVRQLDSSTTFVSDSVSASADISMDDRDATSSRSPPLPSKNVGCGRPPRKAHRRSHSDIPFPFFQSSPTLAAAAPPHQQQRGDLSFSNPAKPSGLGGKAENSWERGVDGGTGVGDDLFNAYMNLDGFDALNSSEENREDFHSRDSGSKTNGADSSENEADSKSNGVSVGLWANQSLLLEHREGGKRSAADDLVQLSNPIARHCRSLSTDSFMGKLNFADESLKLLPSPGLLSGQNSKGGSNGGSLNSFSLEFGNSEFSPAEMKKIMANEKLVEMAMSDPKRVKRILANRQSAARSKERKNRYIVELEHKVQALQTEATTLSAQVTLLQRDSVGLTNRNNELKFRLQAMEQQAQLRDALNEALTAEVQRLKLVVGGPADSHTSSSLNEQTQISTPMFQLQQKQQSSQVAETTK